MVMRICFYILAFIEEDLISNLVVHAETQIGQF